MKKSIKKPGKNNKIDDKKTAETTNNPFILTQAQQSYYSSRIKSVCLSFSKAFVRISA